MRISVAAAVLPPLLLAAASAVVHETCTYTDASCTNKIPESCLRGPDRFDDDYIGYEFYQSLPDYTDYIRDDDFFPLAAYTSCNSLPETRLRHFNQKLCADNGDDTYTKTTCVDTPAPGDSPGGMSKAQTVGIVAGCCCGAVALGVGAVVWRRKNDADNDDADNDAENLIL